MLQHSVFQTSQREYSRNCTKEDLVKGMAQIWRSMGWSAALCELGYSLPLGK